MVPLEKVLQRKGPVAPKDASPALRLYRRRPKPAVEEAPKVRLPRRFKVVDVMTRQVLAEGADTRATVDLLGGIRSVVDVSVYVWDDRTDAWRPLSMGERKTLWNLRGKTATP